MDTVLGIDVGTQSVKVLFYSFANGQVLATSSAPLGIHKAEPGVAEQQADWWLDGVRYAISRIDSSIRRSVCAVAVSGQQHGLVPVDSEGKVVAPVKLWCDTSTAAECDAIMRDYGGADRCLAELGNLILPGYTASKIRWLRDAEPASYEKTTRIMLPHDFLNFWLTGEHCMEAGDASGTGMLDIAERTWSAKLLRAIDPGRDLGECLPEVRCENGRIGALRKEVAAGLGLPAGVPVAIGGGDNMMGAIGTGNVEEGVVTMSLGTSGTVYAYSDTPAVDPDGEIAAFCSSTGGWLPLLCTMNCTASTELLLKLLGAEMNTFEQQLSSSEPGAGGVVVVPFFNGERTPNLPNAKGCVLGLDSGNTRPENLLRAAVEGVCFGLRYGIERLQALGIDTRQIVLTGGGARSGAWRQIVADVCCMPVLVPSIDEGAAFGAALQAYAMQEGEPDIGRIVGEHLEFDDNRYCEPDTTTSSFYGDAFGRYRASVDTLSPLYV